MLEVVGYEVKQGVKRSSGKPYKLEILHCYGDPVPESADGAGDTVETVVFNLLYSGREPKRPNIGSRIRVYYGRTGYPEDYDIII